MPDTLATLVVDAGPLIGLLNRRDPYHADAMRGFEQLTMDGTRITVVLPIVFEVFKWLLHRSTAPTARTALTWLIEDVQIVYSDADALAEIVSLIAARPRWTGTLEDAAVAQAAMRLHAPVWTIDYGDLAAFPNLEFWTPS